MNMFATAAANGAAASSVLNAKPHIGQRIAHFFRTAIDGDDAEMTLAKTRKIRRLGVDIQEDMAAYKARIAARESVAEGTSVKDVRKIEADAANQARLAFRIQKQRQSAHLYSEKELQETAAAAISVSKPVAARTMDPAPSRSHGNAASHKPQTASRKVTVTSAPKATAPVETPAPAEPAAPKTQAPVADVLAASQGASVPTEEVNDHLMSPDLNPLNDSNDEAGEGKQPSGETSSESNIGGNAAEAEGGAQ